MKRLVLVLLLAVGAFAQTVPPPPPLVYVSDDVFFAAINERLGYQAYVDVTYKPIRRLEGVNPFESPTVLKNQWQVIGVEIGTNQLFGKVPMGRGVNYSDAMADLKKNHPYLFP